MMDSGWRVVTDLGLGVLRARGADARTFLQGQLSNDASAVRSAALQLSGYHTPQGRVIALLHLTALSSDDLLAILPAELVPAVVARLSRYVLRAKVRLTDDSAHWQVLGYRGAAPELPGGALSLPYGSTRHLVLVPQGATVAADGATGTREDWLACDIAEGLPQVCLATSEAFVAQMLNLDLLGGIALDKGCYTGQEIIARAHYRGQVKRRMQHFLSDLPCTLAPGQSGTLADGRNFKVVAAVPAADGRCEFLAVAPATPGAVDPEALPATTQTLIPAQQLPLPYELPAARP
jgi:folate-binding protein YgfZ